MRSRRSCRADHREFGWSFLPDRGEIAPHEADITREGRQQEGSGSFCGCLTLKMPRRIPRPPAEIYPAALMVGGGVGYGMRMTVRIWKFEMLAKT
jgi:hypothetical protein